MADTIWLVVRLSDGAVVNATVGGDPDPALPDGFDSVLRVGPASNAWIGWVRDPMGVFWDPAALAAQAVAAPPALEATAQVKA